LPKEGECFKYPCKKFPGLSDAKLKEGRIVVIVVVVVVIIIIIR
jgi:hypothetical protein